MAKRNIGNIKKIKSNSKKGIIKRGYSPPPPPKKSSIKNDNKKK